MSIRLVTGRSGSGKTRFCLDEIRERLQASPHGSPLILLVPEQATFQAEYAMVGTPGLSGFMRAQVLSFRRLAYRIMQETGGSAIVPIDENGKAMLIHKALDKHRGRLRLFRSGGNGLVARINELLTEWKRYGADGEKLRRHAEEEAARASLSGEEGSAALLADKLHDLALVWSELERELEGRWQDGEDMLDWLVRGAPRSALLDGAEVWVDGFHGFTPNEYAVLEALLRRTARVTVTLCLDRPYAVGEMPDELELFHPTAETSRKLLELAEAAGVPVEPPVRLDADPLPRFADSPLLVHLEAALRRGGRWAGDPSLLDPSHPKCGLSVHAAANRRAEVEAAAQDMLRRVREPGCRYRDLAVFVRRLDDYADLLESVLQDYGIPYFVDGKIAAHHHPLAEFIRSALETATGGWRTEAVLRCAKTDLLQPADGTVTRDEVDALENYVLAAGIDGWRWLRGAWPPLPGRDLEAAADEGAEVAADEGAAAADGAEAAAVRDRLIGPLRTLERRFRQARTMRELCEALYLLLEEVGAADRLERWSREDEAAGQPGKARLHRQLWDAVMDLLDQLVELMGSEPADAALFAGMIEAGLEQMRLGSVPPTLDSVLIGTPERTRTGSAAVVYLLGANDGAMPMAVREDGLLSEPERDRLAAAGLPMAPGARRRLLDERFLVYLAFTAASRHLWIGYSLADEEGRGLLPSEYIRRLKRWFPGLPVVPEAGEPQPDDPEEKQLAYAVHPGRAMTHLVGRLRQWRQGGPAPAGWWSVYRWLREREPWRERLSRLLSALRYTNAEPPLEPETSRLLYGERLVASVSRMERFVACPFRHFAAHGLKLRERRLYRVEAPDIGQLFHAALRQATEKLLEEGPAAADSVRWQQEAAAAAERLMPRLQSQILLSSHRHQAMARKLRDIVARASAMLGEHARLSEFRPVGVELAFGPEGPLPPLSLDLGNGRRMDLAGRIDRVDAAETPDGLLLRIMDYKSGAVRLNLDEVAHGLSLQMLAYLDVVLTHAPHWLGRPAEPAGVLYFHVHNPLLSSLNGLSEAEARTAMMKAFRMQGLLLADSGTVLKMDRALEGGGKSLIVPVEFKKDGGFGSRSQVATREQWDVLRRSVRGTIRRIGRRIAGGEVAIAPYRMDRRSPCATCEYRPVCQFDPLMEGNRYQPLARSENRDALWQRLEKLAEGGDEP